MWLFDSLRSTYIELPYRDTWRPPIALWEHKRAAHNARAGGASVLTEDTIFQYVEEGRAIVSASASRSRKARRELSRVKHLVERAASDQLMCPDDGETAEQSMRPSNLVEVY